MWRSDVSGHFTTLSLSANHHYPSVIFLHSTIATLHHSFPLTTMDQVMDGGRLPLEEWFWDMPVCTRWWTTATLLTSALVQCRVVTPFQLFYSFRAVFVKSQVCTARLTFVANSLTIAEVLAPICDVFLFRPLLPRSPLPCIFSTAILSTTGRIVRPVTCTLLLATRICHDFPSPHLSNGIHALPGPSIVFDSRLHLVKAKP